MTLKLAAFLKEKMPWMGDATIEESIRETDRIFKNSKGALGIKQLKGNLLKIVFFAAEDRATRAALIKRAVRGYPNFNAIVFERGKYMNKPFSHSREFVFKLIGV